MTLIRVTVECGCEGLTRVGSESNGGTVGKGLLLKPLFASVLEWHHLFYFKMPDFPKELNSLECEEKACGEFLSQKAIGYILLLNKFHCTKCRGRTQMIKVTSNSANLLKDTSWQSQNETAPFTQEEVSLQMPTHLSFRTSFLNFQNCLV